MKTVVHKRMLVSVEEEVFKELNLKEAQEVTEETFLNIIQLNVINKLAFQCNLFCVVRF